MWGSIGVSLSINEMGRSPRDGAWKTSTAPDDVGPVPLIARIGKGEGRPRAAWRRSEDWACRVSLSSLLLFTGLPLCLRRGQNIYACMVISVTVVKSLDNLQVGQSAREGRWPLSGVSWAWWVTYRGVGARNLLLTVLYIVHSRPDAPRVATLR